MRPGWRAPELEVTSWVFLRALGLVAFVAFVSLASQVDGLVGSGGIQPAGDLLARGRMVASTAGWPAVLAKVPSVLWWFPPTWLDRAIHGLCSLGAAASLALVIDWAPFACLLVIWASYLSLVAVGSVFLHYQWDALLIEASFTALFVAPFARRPGWRRPPTRIGVWLLRLLLFKVVFLSGAAKLASGDPGWRNLDALAFHFMTQPLPSTLSPWVHRLPQGLLRAATAATLLIELLAPAAALSGTWFGGFRSLRLAAFWCIVGLQVLITCTGDHGFYGALVMALALMTVDDRFWTTLVRGWRDRWRGLGLGVWAPPAPSEAAPQVASTPSERTGIGRGHLAGRALVLVLGLTITTVDVLQSFATLSPTWLTYRGFVLLDGLAPFHTINRYASFPVITRQRLEIELQASDDGATFRSYGFWYKPGRLSRPPSRAGLHVPRLDWQMWFAALATDCRHVPWWSAFARRLLEGSPPVLDLLEHAPGRPKFLRAVLHEYRFTPPSPHPPSEPSSAEETGTWWTRRPVAIFCPTMTLTDTELVFVDD